MNESFCEQLHLIHLNRADCKKCIIHESDVATCELSHVKLQTRNIVNKLYTFGMFLKLESFGPHSL